MLDIHMRDQDRCYSSELFGPPRAETDIKEVFASWITIVRPEITKESRWMLDFRVLFLMAV
jgi:hypothetical protein